MIPIATEFWGIAKGSNHLSRSKSSHSIYSGSAKNRHSDSIENDNAIKRLLFVLILCSTIWLRIVARYIVKPKSVAEGRK